MVPPEGDNESAGIRVTDRRRLTEDGEPRSESTAAPETPSEEARPAEPAPPPTSGVDEPRAEPTPEELPVDDDGLPPIGARQLGIEAVFYVFWQSAMLALGMPDPMGRRMPLNLDEARNAIDLMKLLEDKTRGNLTKDEEATIRGLLHEAQLKYVEVVRHAGGTQ